MDDITYMTLNKIQMILSNIPNEVLNIIFRKCNRWTQISLSKVSKRFECILMNICTCYNNIETCDSIIHYCQCGDARKCRSNNHLCICKNTFTISLCKSKKHNRCRCKMMAKYVKEDLMYQFQFEEKIRIPFDCTNAEHDCICGISLLKCRREGDHKKFQCTCDVTCEIKKGGHEKRRCNCWNTPLKCRAYDDHKCFCPINPSKCKKKFCHDCGCFPGNENLCKAHNKHRCTCHLTMFKLETFGCKSEGNHKCICMSGNEEICRAGNHFKFMMQLKSAT